MTPAAARREQVNVRLTEEARDILLALHRKLGISQAGVLEIVLREEAERRGITLPTKKK